MMKRGRGGLFLWWVIHSCHASSLGVVGETFPVAERSMLHLIESRVRTLLQTEDFEQSFVHTIQAYARRPTPNFLPRAHSHHIHHYTPMVYINQDLIDTQNHLIVAKGTYLNALEKRPDYKPHWIFINGDDAAQRQFGHRQLQRFSNAKVILTDGSIQDAEQAFHQQVFFDQGARLVHQLDIKHMPALVFRLHNQLAIHEYAIDADGQIHE